MSIREDKEFIKYFEKVLMAPYLFKEGLKNNEEIPISIYEELVERQKRCNAHLTKVMILLGKKENE